MAQVERITESHQIKQDIPGGIQVSHRSKEEIESLARFAVDEHNKKAKAHLVFEKVVLAMDQVVAGIMCYITLLAADGHKQNVYEAKVLEQPWLKVKELVEFKLIVGT